MADMVSQIDGMTTDACTFSVGVLHGGQWVNCVASTAEGEALSMAKRQSDLDQGVARMLALTKGDDDTGRFIVTRGVTRPVWEPNDKTMALYETAKGLAKQLGIDLKHESAGGGSDANFTGALGHRVARRARRARGGGAHVAGAHHRRQPRPAGQAHDRVAHGAGLRAFRQDEKRVFCCDVGAAAAPISAAQGNIGQRPCRARFLSYGGRASPRVAKAAGPKRCVPGPFRGLF